MSQSSAKLPRLAVLICCFFLVWPGIVQGAPLPNDIKAIVSSYDQACAAAQLKYLRGMVAHRASWFEATGADGRRMDLSRERVRLRDLMSKALTVEEKTTARDFQQRGSDILECRTEDVLRLTVADAELEVRILVLRTESVDRWQRTELGWKQVHSRLVAQTWSRLEGQDVR